MSGPEKKVIDPLGWLSPDSPLFGRRQQHGVGFTKSAQLGPCPGPKHLLDPRLFPERNGFRGPFGREALSPLPVAVRFPLWTM